MIQAGDIILVRGNHPIISPIVRWFTGSEYTHVGLAVTSSLIYEININKKMGIHYNTHEDYDVFRYKYGLTIDQKRKMAQYAIDQALKNNGYDWLKVISFALEKIFRVPFVFDQVNRKICSEIVDKIYASVGIDLVPYKKTGHVTPYDLSQSQLLYKVY